jgi:hypothetical protein
MQHIGNLDVEHESLVVLHDPKSGQILHLHAVQTMRGGAHPDEKTREADARAQLARGRHTAVANIAVLHADPKSIKPGTGYKVDIQKRVLVEVPNRKA